jgi:16S rRNA (guanine527-N7)-methyltransferase
LDLDLAPDQLKAFSLYAEELLRWNRKMNLTGLHEEVDVVISHFLASLAFTVAFSRGLPLRMADIGSGAGFPGIPIKIACPQLRVTLVEASRKKVSFLHHVCTRLQLEGIEAVRARAEELAVRPSCREGFDICVARAVGRRESLLAVVGPLLRSEGRFILSAREREEGPWPESASLAFQQERKVRFPSLGLQRRLLIWERRAP